MPVKDKVLVVDDSETDRMILSLVLAQAGYEVLMAASGEEALARARECRPDLILLDIVMPGLDGFDVAVRLREDPLTKIIPIALVTTLDDVESKVKGFNAGVDDFFNKPVHPMELLARARSLIKLKRFQEEFMTRHRAGAADLDVLEAPADMPRTVLIVDDDESICLNLSNLLEAAGFTTRIAMDGSQALAQLGEQAPEILLLDLMLPDMNGLELLRKVKDNAVWNDMPVIVISCLSDLESRITGLEMGADDFLVKPFNSAELIARIRVVQRKSAVRKSLRDQAARLFRQSITDSLTGLFNRMYLKTVVEREIAAAARFKSTFCLCFLDIDDFKAVNDRFGHLAGDGILRQLGDLIAKRVRSCDLAARYGGEEFAIMISKADLPTARVFVERLLEEIASHPFSGVDGGRITVSAGITEILPEDRGLEHLVRKADLALYRAKKDGKNRVRVYIPPSGDISEAETKAPLTPTLSPSRGRGDHSRTIPSPRMRGEGQGEGPQFIPRPVAGRGQGEGSQVTPRPVAGRGPG